MANRKIRVRSKRLEQISADRMALALWLMARDYVDEQSATPAQPPKDDDQTPRKEKS